MNADKEKGFGDEVEVTVPVLYRVSPDFIAKLYTYPVVKQTNRGYWIKQEHGYANKWVPNHGEKRYAWPNKQDAIDQFKKQKQSEIESYELRIAALKNLIQIADAI